MSTGKGSDSVVEAFDAAVGQTVFDRGEDV
jgi:hypothetical protein